MFFLDGLIRFAAAGAAAFFTGIAPRFCGGDSLQQRLQLARMNPAYELAGKQSVRWRT